MVVNNLSLVICPNHLTSQWIDEVSKSTSPKLKSVLLTTMKEVKEVTYSDILEAGKPHYVSFVFISNFWDVSVEISIIPIWCRRQHTWLSPMKPGFDSRYRNLFFALSVKLIFDYCRYCGCIHAPAEESKLFCTPRTRRQSEHGWRCACKACVGLGVEFFRGKFRTRFIVSNF